jgi:hypothetical protein
MSGDAAKSTVGRTENATIIRKYPRMRFFIFSDFEP